MANSGPGTNGSQFFLVYKNSLSLPASYTPFGTIVGRTKYHPESGKGGQRQFQRSGDGHPKDKVEINERHDQEDVTRFADRLRRQ